MRTVRCSGHLVGGGCLPKGDVCWGCVCPGGYLPKGVVCPGGVCLGGVHPPCEQNDWQTGAKALVADGNKYDILSNCCLYLKKKEVRNYLFPSGDKPWDKPDFLPADASELAYDLQVHLRGRCHLHILVAMQEETGENNLRLLV